MKYTEVRLNDSTATGSSTCRCSSASSCARRASKALREAARNSSARATAVLSRASSRAISCPSCAAPASLTELFIDESGGGRTIEGERSNSKRTTIATLVQPSGSTLRFNPQVQPSGTWLGFTEDAIIRSRTPPPT